MNDKELTELTGQNFKDVGYPQIKINEEDLTPDGKEIPRGTWALQVEGETLYSPTVHMQIMMSTMQYRKWDNAKKATERTIHFRDFGEELIDTLGTQRLGRPIKKVMDTLPPNVQAEHRKVRLYRWVFGLASMEGVNDNGEKNAFVNVPSFFRFSGHAYMKVDPYLREFDRDKVLLPAYITNFSLERITKGVPKTMWVPSPARADKVVMNEDIIPQLRKFGEFVERENNYILSVWKKKHTDKDAPLNDNIDDLIKGVSSDMNLED